MQLFVLFLLASFVAGMFLWNKSRAWRIAGLLLVCAFMVFAYFFLNQV